MASASPPRLEFFAKRNLRRELSIGLMAPLSAAVLYRRALAHEVVLVLIASVLGVWIQRRRPILVIDGDRIRLPWNLLGEKDLVRRRIRAWCWTSDGKRLAFHLHSQLARVIDVSTLSLEERSAITHALAERGYAQVRPGPAELGAIRTERIYQQLRPLGCIAVLVLAFVAVLSSLELATH
jgi:hypothetical protein